ncbi:MAG: DUF3575 domain-containing protein [Paludibacteraceae bacterium]
MKKLLILTFALVMAMSSLSAQDSAAWKISDGALLDGRNIVKVNLTGIALGNYGFYGERIINNRFSFILGVNFMPSSSIHYSILLDEKEKDVEESISNLKVNSFALIPELRIYAGSGYGKGFYLAPYFKYEQFGLSDLRIKFTDNNDETEAEIIMDGKLKTYSGGLMIGYQWLIGKNKNFVIDWSILGIHAGKSQGNIHGYYAKGEMTEEQQEDVKKGINETLGDIPLIKYTTTVDEKNANLDFKGPWAFFRMGLSIGYRF